MKEYEKTLGKNNPVQNAMAFSYLLENGRKTILNEDYYNKTVEQIKNDNRDLLMTPDFQIEVLDIARNMANMKEKDLQNYIYDKVKETRKLEKGR